MSTENKHWVRVQGAVELPLSVTQDQLHDALMDAIEALGGEAVLITSPTIPDEQ